MSKAIVVAERDNIAAVIEDGRVCEFYIHRGDMLMNDVYLASVDNILPSIDAAFVNVGYDKMGFLHADDAIGRGTLKEKLSPKQKIIVQVVKEPVGHKGPRVSTMISLPGRFLVLIPQETGINVSRKIVNNKERARLKSIISLIKPAGVGVIVRTEAEGQSDTDIQEDLEILLDKWNTIAAAAETRPVPSLLYRDQDLLYMVMREACDEDVDEIILDTSYGMHRAEQILQNWNMNKNIEVNVYKGSQTLLEASGVMKEIKDALQTKVNLPSGGYLFIQATEALTVIDVNSGKFVSSSTQDETILKTNLEAVHEIARQLRLRNIGGMVIIDFIDMNTRRDKLAIMEELELALEKDKAKPQVGQLSDLGLVELTRHRQGQSLEEIFSRKCPHCQGSGHIAEDFILSAPAAEGELKAKAAKLKVPVHQIKNKNSNFKQNKVFSNPNNNPLANDADASKNVNNNENKGRQNKFNRYNKFNRQNDFKEQEAEKENAPEFIEEKNQLNENHDDVKIENIRTEEIKPAETALEKEPEIKTEEKKEPSKKQPRQPKQRGMARRSRKSAKLEEETKKAQEALEASKEPENNKKAEEIQPAPKKRPGRRPKKKEEDNINE